MARYEVNSLLIACLATVHVSWFRYLTLVSWSRAGGLDLGVALIEGGLVSANGLGEGLRLIGCVTVGARVGGRDDGDEFHDLREGVGGRDGLF
jgi:hypothetical protein